MPERRVTLDLFHVEVRVPAGVPQPAADAMSRMLRSAAFRRHPELASATVRVT